MCATRERLRESRAAVKNSSAPQCPRLLPGACSGRRWSCSVTSGAREAAVGGDRPQRRAKARSRRDFSRNRARRGLAPGRSIVAITRECASRRSRQGAEKRGFAFCRYADDCNVYVRSKRAGDDAMETLRHLFTKLKLRVNEAKSAVARLWERKFLGYTFWINKKTGELKRGIADKALATMKERLRTITSRTRGRSIAAVIEELRLYLLGWKNYFHLQERPSLFRELDGWIRHRLRMLHLKQWKNGPNAYRQLRARGL